MNYLDNQFMNYAPVRLESLQPVKVKLSSDRGATNWLNIDATAARAIEEAIEGSYKRTLAAGGHACKDLEDITPAQLAAMATASYQTLQDDEICGIDPGMCYVDFDIRNPVTGRMFQIQIDTADLVKQGYRLTLNRSHPSYKPQMTVIEEDGNGPARYPLT